MLTNDDYFKLLDISLPDNYDHYTFDMEIDGPTKIITISTTPMPTLCPFCNSSMHSKGIYTRTVKHPVLQDNTLLYLKVKQRRWKCTGIHCSYTFNEEFPFLEPYRQSTNMIPFMIINSMKDLNRSTASIAKQFNVSDSYVHDLFTSYVDLSRLEMPEYLSIDEVHINLGTDMKYQLVMMDFKNNQIVDILSNRYQSTIENYLLHISLEERKKVKYLISDAYAPYFTLCEKYFPNAIQILDSFHVVQIIIRTFNAYINVYLKKYQEKDRERLKQLNHDTHRENKTIEESTEVILLRNYRWLLLKNNDDIEYSEIPRYQKLLKMHLTTDRIEKMLFALNPNFETMRDLKEKYIQFNKQEYPSLDNIAIALDVLINEYTASGLTMFIDFAEFLKQHRNPIIHSFTTTTVNRTQRNKQIEFLSRISNGPMEGFNRIPKDLKRASRGMKNFDYTRNRILWATRINPPIKSIPKTKEQIHSYSLSKKTMLRRAKQYKKTK